MKSIWAISVIVSILVLGTLPLDAFAVPIWSASGPGTVTVTDADQGDDNIAEFTYNVDPAGLCDFNNGLSDCPNNTWTFESTATDSGLIEIQYDWNGNHCVNRCVGSEVECDRNIID